MATATSLTAETIEEMMSGWVQVSVVQESQAALLSTFEAILAEQTESLTTWNEETLPALYAETEAASIALSNLSGTVIPDLQVQLDGHEENLDQLNDVVIPDLQAGLNSNYEWIANLNDVVLPELYANLAANEATMTEFNDVTLPALQADIAANEAAIAAIDISGLESDLSANTAALNTLNTVTIPALESDISANDAALNTLNTVTIPGLASDISANETAINNLNTTTLPGLDTRLDAAEADVSTLEGKFPITGPDIAANAVTANKIAANTITANEIATDAITADEIAADTITANEIAANAVTVNELAANAVTATKIAADAVTAGKIAADAITAREIQADAITASEIAADAVTATEIAANAVTANKIQADAVTAGKIAADAITAREIQADSVTASEIAANTITASEIAADTITANQIASNAITANEIAANAVIAAKIQADAVTAGKIAADAITAREIQADSVTASEIAANTITANEIAADTITANQIAADAITASEIATGTITALEIAGGTITGEKIAADTIAVTKLIISDLENLVVDGDLLDPTSATWFEMGGPTGITRVKNAGEPAYLKNRNKYSTTHIFFRNENIFEIKDGDEFYVSCEVFTPAGNTETLEFMPTIAVYNLDGGSELWRNREEGVFMAEPNLPWTKVEGTIKISGTNLATAQFNPLVQGIDGANDTQEIRIRKMSLRRKGTGKLIIDGTIQGKNIEANTITSDQIDSGTITGDLFAGEVIFGGLIRAGDLDDVSGLITGGYAEMGANGIYTVDASGEPVFYAPTSSGDGAYLKAHVDLLSADVKDNFTMHGTNNIIATEAELTLSAGVVAPSVPPVLQQVWDQIQFNKTQVCAPHTPNPGYNLGSFAFNPSQASSMCWDSTWSCWVVLQQRSNGFRVWRFTSTGAIYNNISTGRPWVDDYNDRLFASVAFNDDLNGFATIFKSGDDWYLWAPNNINRIPAAWIIDNKGPVLTYDTINNQYVLVQTSGGGAGALQMRRFTVTAGANFPNATNVSTNGMEAGSGLSVRLNGAVFGAQSGLANSWVVNSDSYQTVYVFTGAGVMQDDEGTYRNWLKPGASLAFAHNGTQFVSLDSAGIATFYENWTWLQKDAYVWVGASAADTTAGDGSLANPHVGQAAGTHETPVGTMRSISLYRRSKLRITMPETNDSGAADDPDKWRLYFKRGTNVAPTDKTLLKLIGDIGSSTASTSITISTDPTGIAPPGGIQGQPTAYNNFPGADPGRIESAGIMAVDSLPILQMLGSGAGRWGTLTVDTNGKAVIGGDSGWINMTLTNGFAAYGSPYATPSYRKIGSRVYLRGLADLGTITTAIATLPVGYRPVAQEMFATVLQQITKDVSGDNIPTFNSGAASAGTSHNHPVNAPALDMTVTTTNVGGRVTITTGGVITADTAGQPAGGWVSLSGISFMTD